jgi:hypothetical protein
MPTCIVCEGDGVLEALGHWYCVEHLEEGFIDVANYIAQIRSWNATEVTEQLWAWLEQ